MSTGAVDAEGGAIDNMAKVGRPKGESCSQCRCLARVRVMISTEVSGGMAYAVYKCWQHYVDMENNARSSKSFRIISAELIKHRR